MITSIIKKYKQFNKMKKEREDCIKYTLWAMNWTRKEAEKICDRAYYKYHIPYKYFANYELCRLPEKEWEIQYIKKLELRDKSRNRKEEKYLEKVCEITGWSRTVAREKMEYSREISGASFENYFNFRFWELNEEQQKSYYTKGDVIELKKKYNTDSKIKNILRSKEETYKYLEDYIGRKWLTTDKITKDVFVEKFGYQGKIIYKPISSLGGQGIESYTYDENSIDNLIAELSRKKRGLVEAFLTQHEILAKYSQGSVNTIRIVTITTTDKNAGIEPNEVHFIFAALRMGMGNSCVDNMHKGGLVAAVDINTGKIITDGINYENKIYENHPETNAAIKGTELPYFKEAKEIIKAISKNMPGFFGWDIAITEQGPVVIEVNISPGAGALQLPYIPEKRGMKYIVKSYL